MSITTPIPERADLNHANRIAAIVISLFALFCLWYSSTHQLLEDESYYWQWSRHLSAGYYDNTPGMAYVIRLFTTIFGNTELGVRSGAVVCACVAAWFLYKLASEMFGGAVGLAALAAALFNPFFCNGAWIMSADPPQICFWMLCAWASWRAANSPPDSTDAWKWWLLSGLVAGLAAMSKLNGLLILPSVLLFLILDPAARIWLKKPHPYVAALLALIIFSPFIWWNHTHGNAFWTHINAMGSRTDRSHGHFTLKYLGDFLGAQAILISPLLFLTFLWTLIATPKRTAVDPASPHSRALRYCWCLSVVVFAATLLLSLKSRVEGNWAVASYLTGFILVGYAIAHSWRRVPTRAWHIAAVGLGAFLAVFTYISTFTTTPPRVKVLDKRTNELFGWRTMAARVQQEEQATGGNPFVFGLNYRMPSELAFYLPGQPRTYSLFLNVRANEYMFWENERDLIGRNAIMVNDVETADHLDDARAVFQRVEVEPPLLIYRAPYKQPIRTVQIFRCYGFKGYDRRRWQDGW